MKVLKIIKLSESKEKYKIDSNEDFAHSHRFGVRIKNSFLSHQDANVFVNTNLPEISLDEVVNTIELQDKSIMCEILKTLRSKNSFDNLLFGKNHSLQKLEMKIVNFIS